MKEYTISSRHKKFLVSSATILGLIFVFRGFIMDSMEYVDLYLPLITFVLYAVAKSYILYQVILYFKFYDLRTLSILTSIILAAELFIYIATLFWAIFTENLDELGLPLYGLGLVLQVIWFIFLFPLRKKEYSSIATLFQYCVSNFYALIGVFLLSVVGALFIDLGMFGNPNLILAIPYLYLVKFGLELKPKQNVELDVQAAT
jgi:hypothetical protein